MKNKQPDNPRTDNNDVVLRARLGDAQAMDSWLRRDHPSVFRICLGFLGDYAAAEDLAQEAMVKLMDRLDSWNASKSFRAWRNTVVANLCRDRLRIRKHATFEPLNSTREQRTPAHSGPNRDAESNELKVILIDALGNLSPREREVFVLRDLEGIPTAEVAITLAVTESSVRSILTLARRRLRDLLSRRLDLDEGKLA